MWLITDVVLVLFLVFLSRKITLQIAMAESLRHCRCREEEESEEPTGRLFFLIFAWLLFFSSGICLAFRGSSLWEGINLIFCLQFFIGIVGMLFGAHKKTLHLVLGEYGFKAVFAATAITVIFLVFCLFFLSP
jgi:hypothetical protein